MNYSGINDIQIVENDTRRIFDYLDLPVERLAQQGSTLTGQPIHTIIGGSSKYEDYLKTKYFSTESTLIHFTSLKALFSIINERSFRLYNLINSDDKKEYVTASKKIINLYKSLMPENKIGYSQRIPDIKEVSFILSSTLFSELNNPFFWNKYANKGKGVALEFEIRKKREDWVGFFLAPVQYGNLEKWDEAVKLLAKLRSKNPLLSFDLQFDNILSYHKKAKYKPENEVRILGFSCMGNNYQSFYETLINHDTGKKGTSMVKYFKLPLFVSPSFPQSFENEKRIRDASAIKTTNFDMEFNAFRGTIPLLKIKKVYFSQNFPEKDYPDAKRCLIQSFLQKFGYSLEVERIGYKRHRKFRQCLKNIIGRTGPTL